MVMYRDFAVNENLTATQILNTGGKRTVDIVVRNIEIGEWTRVKFKFIRRKGSQTVILPENSDRYNFLPLGSLYVPINCLRIVEGIPRVRVYFVAPQSVVFSGGIYRANRIAA